MRRFLAALMVVVMLVSCTSPAIAKKSKKRTKGRKQQPKQEQSSSDAWLNGGDLYEKKISDWKRATKNKKVATCGVIIATAALNERLALKPTTHTLKGYAEVLTNAIDSAINANSNNKDVLTLKVMDVAVMGMAYLGWLK